MQLQPNNSMALASAWYGPLDVAHKVREAFCVHEHLLVDPSVNFNTVFGDPCPGQKKVLRLVFTDGNVDELHENRNRPFYRTWAPPPPLEQLHLVYVLFFNAYSLAKAYERFGAHPWCVPLYVPTSSLFENHAICQAPVLATRDNWAVRRCVGFISWRATEKLADIVHRIQTLLDGHDWEARDAVPLCSFPAQAGRFGDPFFCTHPGLEAVWERHIVPRFGDLPFASWRCSYWMATPAAVLEYAHFLRTELLPALWADNDCFKDAKYVRPVTPEMTQAGWPYYPLLPFFLERVVGKFFQHRTRARVEAA
jgi:hypothetical protein